MAVSEDFGKFIFGFVNGIRDENIRWQKENIPTLNELDEQRKFSKQKIEQELKRREIQFKYDIEQMEMEGDSKMRDFKDFLEAIDKIKDDFRQNFQKMNLPIVLSIHQYGKRLLVSMWNSNNLQERTKYEQQLMDFLYTVHEDMSLVSSQENQDGLYLPEKTLKLIRQQGQ